MNDFFAGLDVSTQGQKIVVIDLQKNSVIYSDSINYDLDLPKYSTLNGVIRDTETGVSESSPKMWIDALHLIFERLKKLKEKHHIHIFFWVFLVSKIFLCFYLHIF